MSDPSERGRRQGVGGGGGDHVAPKLTAGSLRATLLRPRAAVAAGCALIVISLGTNWYEKQQNNTITNNSGTFGGYQTNPLGGPHGVGWLTVLAMIAALALLVPNPQWRERWSPRRRDGLMFVLLGLIEIAALLIYGLTIGQHDLPSSAGGSYTEVLLSGTGWYLVLLGGILTIIGGWRVKRASSRSGEAARSMGPESTS